MKKIRNLLLVGILVFSVYAQATKITSVIGQTVIGITKTKSNIFKSGIFYLEEKKISQMGVTENLPMHFSLEQNYPNPFNPTTTIKFSLPSMENVKITVFNILGKEVAAITKGKFEKGYHSIIFDGSKLTSGQYFYKINTGKFTKIRKMLLIK